MSDPKEQPLTMVPGKYKDPAKKPCRECPLAPNMPGYLGGYTIGMYLELLDGPADVACHMSGGFPTPEEARSCVGVVCFRSKQPEWRATWGMLAGHATTAAALSREAEGVFDTREQFAEFHSSNGLLTNPLAKKAKS